MFYSEILDSYISEPSRTLVTTIRRQMENNWANQSVRDTSTLSLYSIIFLLIFAFITNLFDNRALLYMTTLLRSLEVILHLPLLRITVPAHVGMMFSILVPFFTSFFDIILELFEATWTDEFNLIFE